MMMKKIIIFTSVLLIMVSVCICNADKKEVNDLNKKKNENIGKKGYDGTVKKIFGAGDKKISGVTFPGEIIVDGKKLTLNGVAIRKAYIFAKVYVSGLYLEHPTKDVDEAIESEQTKGFLYHYLTDRATAKKLQKGFISAMKKVNPPKLVIANLDKIKRYASFLDKNMIKDGESHTMYVPGNGITVNWMGKVKGTIAGKEFAQMYFHYNLGSKVDDSVRNGFMGIEKKKRKKRRRNEK